jgi:hypothetical protein
MDDLMYLVSPSKFKGNAITLAKPESLQHKLNECRTQYPDIIALSWDDFYDQFLEPHQNSMQKPFREITEKEWDDALCELPPMRWTRGEGEEFFFCSEPYSSHLHQCYVRKGEKYYTALRSRFDKDEDLLGLKNVE